MSGSVPTAGDEGRRQRLRWRSRRGLLELELLLGRYVDAALANLDEQGLEQYEQLLEYDDVDVHEWLLDRSLPPTELQGIVGRIRRQLALDPDLES